MERPEPLRQCRVIRQIGKLKPGQDVVITGASGGLGLAAIQIVRKLGGRDDFAIVNEVYASYFSEPRPARATVQVARLPRDARIEIDAIASFAAI